MTEKVDRCNAIASNANTTLRGMKHCIRSQKHYSLTYAPLPPLFSFSYLCVLVPCSNIVPSLLDSCWIVRTVSRLSGQFFNCPVSFLIARTVFGLSGKFLDYPDSS